MNRMAWPVALLLACGAPIAAAQADPWAPIRRLVGEWSGTSSGRPVVFESVAFENFGAEWKARETYQFVSDDELLETFELAPPGKPYQTYSRATLKRVRR